MLSALILLGALGVIVFAITTVWSDSSPAYKKRISLFGNEDNS